MVSHLTATHHCLTCGSLTRRFIDRPACTRIAHTRRPESCTSFGPTPRYLYSASPCNYCTLNARCTVMSSETHIDPSVLSGKQMARTCTEDPARERAAIAIAYIAHVFRQGPLFPYILLYARPVSLATRKSNFTSERCVCHEEDGAYF